MVMMEMVTLRVTALTLTVTTIMTAVMMFIQRNGFTLSQESISECLM